MNCNGTYFGVLLCNCLLCHELWGRTKSRNKIGSEQKPLTAAEKTRKIGVPLPYPTNPLGYRT